MEFLIFILIAVALVFVVRFLVRRMSKVNARKPAKVRELKRATDERCHQLLTERGFTLEGRKAESRHIYTRDEANQDFITVHLNWLNTHGGSSMKSITVARNRKIRTEPGSFNVSAVFTEMVNIDVCKNPQTGQQLLKVLRKAEKAANKDIKQDSF